MTPMVILGWAIGIYLGIGLLLTILTCWAVRSSWTPWTILKVAIIWPHWMYKALKH